MCSLYLMLYNELSDQINIAQEGQHSQNKEKKRFPGYRSKSPSVKEGTLWLVQLITTCLLNAITRHVTSLWWCAFDSMLKALHMQPDCSLNSTTKDPEGVGVSEMAEERCYPLNTASVDTSWASSRPSLINFYGGHLVGVRHRQICRLSCHFTNDLSQKWPS